MSALTLKEPRAKRDQYFYYCTIKTDSATDLFMSQKFLITIKLTVSSKKIIYLSQEKLCLFDVYKSNKK